MSICLIESKWGTMFAVKKISNKMVNLISARKMMFLEEFHYRIFQEEYSKEIEKVKISEKFLFILLKIYIYIRIVNPKKKLSYVILLILSNGF